MKVTLIKDLQKEYKDLDGKEICVAGWVKSVRANGSIGFIDLNDGTAFKGLQVVFDAKLENFDVVEKLNTGSSVVCSGKLVLTPEAKQPYEMHAQSVEVVSATDNEYPLQKKRHSIEFLRDLAYLRPRTNTFQAVFRIRSVAAMAVHTYFQEHGFLYVHTPLITCTDCEGSDQMFKVTTFNFDNLPKLENGKVDFSQDLFGKEAFITGSGQLHGEAFAMAFNKIYTFGPTFRTENSNTKIHANEFWMIEPEMAFCDLNGLMDTEEEMLKFVVKYVMEKCPDELEFCDKWISNGLLNKLNNLVNSEFKRISHHDCIDLLKKSGRVWEFEPDYEGDIQKEHEKYLTEYFGGPVFITDWPKDIKAYYMKVNPDGKTVAAVDLIVPEAGELMGGSQREENLDVLLKRMHDLNVDESKLDWYVNLRRFGGCVHAGFGMGFERLIIYLTGMDNIRDVIPFPRTPKNCQY
ncbi:MAG TPA: asparagine--tRNA ligase [Clostridiales bacterium]|nr:asparagine--tRNA ligase [Clostridiales bacterium]